MAHRDIQGMVEEACDEAAGGEDRDCNVEDNPAAWGLASFQVWVEEEHLPLRCWVFRQQIFLFLSFLPRLCHPPQSLPSFLLPERYSCL